MTTQPLLRSLRLLAPALAVILLSAALASNANAQPVAPAGFTVRVAAQGGLLAGRHLAAIAIAPSGTIYVATATSLSSSTFTLLAIAPSGTITSIGTYGIPFSELVELEHGPDGRLYTMNQSGVVIAINPATGASSTYSNTQSGVGRYSLEFDAAGNLILMPEGSCFYRVIPGTGRQLLGCSQFSHGDRGGIQPDGDYIIYSDSGDQVVELETSGHVVGQPFPTVQRSSTVFQNAPFFFNAGYSLGAIHPLTGDIYSTIPNFGNGAAKVAITLTVGTATTPSNVFLSNIGNAQNSSTAIGVTDLDFGPSSDGVAPYSLYFLDDFTDRVYEVLGSFYAVDADGDGVHDLLDNCLGVANPSQADSNGDGAGDACQPTIDVGPVTSSGGNLRASVTIADPNNDQLSGVIEVLRPSNLTGISIQNLDTCGNDTFSVTLNGVAIGTVPGNANAHCQCVVPGGVQTTVMNAAAIASAYQPGSNNMLHVSKTGTSTTVAWIKAVFSFADRPTADVCMFDALGGSSNCTEQSNLCNAGNSSNTLSLQSAQSFSSVALSSAYANSQLPAFLDVSGLAAGSYVLRGTTTDGNTSPVADASAFNLNGESRLYINRQAATLTLSGLNHVYDGTPKTATVTTSPGGLSTVTITYNGSATSPTNAGQYEVVATLTSDEYEAEPVTDTLVIARAPLTITADNKSKTYGAAVPPLTASYSGFVAGEGVNTLDVPVSLSTTATATSAVGSYPITASGASDANYDITFVSGTLSVTAAALTVRANDESRTYGAADPSFTATITGFTNDDDEADLAGTLAFTTSATTASSPGSYPITPSGLTSPNYAINFVDGTLTVTRAALTVRANDASRVYGAPNPSFTASFSGFVNSETPTVLGGALQFTTSATAASSVGTYAVTPSGLTSNNYAITFINGSLTITAATLTVTADPTTKVYGAPVPTLTASFSGFVGSDTAATAFTGSPELTTTATSASGVGSYPIAVAQGTLAATNYVFTFVTGTLTVSAATLTVTADAKARPYGAENPTLTTSYGGFVNGDTASVVAGTAALSTTATAASPVGSYAISVALGTLSAANYSFVFVDGTLTVSAAHLTVTADTKTRTYGSANPSLTATITGFVGAETEAALRAAGALTGAAECTTTATPSSPVGNSPYAITCAVGTLSATNYQFAAFVAAELTIEKAVLTITPDNKTKTYGQSVSLTGAITGQRNGDVFNATYTSDGAAAAAPVGTGTYPITVLSVTGPELSNYTENRGTGILTLDKAVLVIQPNNVAKIYGTAATLTGVITGQQNGDAFEATYASAGADAAAPVGTGSYPVTVSDVQGPALANYSEVRNSGTLTIAKANQAITVTTPVPSAAIYATTFGTAAIGGGSVNAVSITTAGVCSVSSGGAGSATIQMTGGTGTCTVYYNQAGDSNHNAAPQVAGATTAQKAAQAIVVTAGAPSTAAFGSSFTVAAAGGGSGNPVVITTPVSDGCSDVGPTFTVISGVAACQVTYNQAGNANYLAAPQIVQVVSTVGYGFEGFFQPIDMSTPTTTVWNRANAGQAIPAKWRLTLIGQPVSSLSSFVGLFSYEVNCTTGAGEIEDAIEEYAPGASGLIYDGDGRFHFNWKTPTTYKNKCRAMYVSFSDGSVSPIATFRFR